MLQDPYGINSIQNALHKLLDDLGIEFLPSEWEMQGALLQPSENSELDHLLAYLNTCKLSYQVFQEVLSSEVKHLGEYTIAATKQGNSGLLKNLQTTSESEPVLSWAVQLNPLSGHSTREEIEPGPENLMAFWRKLRNSVWLREALQFEKGSFKPVIYASLLINLLALAGPLFSLQVYDRIIPNQAYASMAALLMGVTICLWFEHTLKHARHHLMEFAATSIDTRCTGHLSKSLLNVPIHKTEPTILLQHLRSFEHLRELITGVFLLALIDLPFLILFLVVIALIHPLFLLVSGSVIGLTLIMIVSSHRGLAQLGQTQMKQSRQTQNQWLDSLACLDNIQAHGVQQAHSKLLATLQLKARLGGNAVRDQLFKVNQQVHLLQQGSWILTISLGVFLIVEQQMTVGGLIAVSMLTMRCFAPIQKLQSHLVQTHSAQASFEELDRFLNQKKETRPTASALSAIEMISLESACILKPGCLAESGQAKQFILKNIDLNLQKGMRIGVIGPTGSGKTSLLRLLALQLPCDQGHLTVNHLVIDHYHPREFNSKVGYASQPPILIKGSLLDNIRFMRPHIDTKSCWQIIQDLGMHDWVEQHPDGLHMHIDSHGNNLSSGQKQGISLCRALVGQPELILLDEPTVCLDQYMENKLIHFLQNLPESTILLFTTHKLGLLACANGLVLMNQGKIHAQGSKAQVLHEANAIARSREMAIGTTP
jgi:ATP-binding cassette subfamily C protein LapB